MSARTKRRRLELEKQAAEAAANKKMLEDSLRKRDEVWEKEERKAALREPMKGARHVSARIMEATNKGYRA